ncbi:MAG: divalent-cation tolerance protein CutA [Alphaproteobacteria bacterium]
MTDSMLVYVTFADHAEARRIAALCVEGRLAACANIFPPHHAVYMWDGAVQDSQEVAAIFKTTCAGFEALQRCIAEHHSYDTPCIVALDIADGAAPFLQWIEQSVGKI